MPTYRTVLRSGEFRAVLGAHVFAMLAMIIGDFSLTVLVYQRTSSPLLSSLTFAIGFVPMGLGALFLGGVGRHRCGRRRSGRPGAGRHARRSRRDGAGGPDAPDTGR